MYDVTSSSDIRKHTHDRSRAVSEDGAPERILRTAIRDENEQNHHQNGEGDRQSQGADSIDKDVAVQGRVSNGIHV